jgi:hypothetical protein
MRSYSVRSGRPLFQMSGSPNCLDVRPPWNLACANADLESSGEFYTGKIDKCCIYAKLFSTALENYPSEFLILLCFLESVKLYSE